MYGQRTIWLLFLSAGLAVTLVCFLVWQQPERKAALPKQADPINIGGKPGVALARRNEWRAGYCKKAGTLLVLF